MSPTPTTSSAARSPPPRCPPPRPATPSLLRLGPAGSASPSPGAWRAPAATAPRWPASLPPTTRLVVEVNRTDRQPGAARASPTPSTLRPPPGPSRPAQARVVPKAGGGQVEMIRRLRVARADRHAGPHPGHQHPQRRCWSPLPPSSASSSAAAPRPGWCRRRPPWSRARSPARWPPPPSPWASWPAATRPSRPRSTPSPPELERPGRHRRTRADNPVRRRPRQRRRLAGRCR